ncbi:hypothetical protein HMPREF9373_0599 [Psychrobacter sp. 1501(2011)]|nr:hypothetical protein HMPREF9373_0599 [Psychrobacter sp. 1501(2011)]
MYPNFLLYFEFIPFYISASISCQLSLLFSTHQYRKNKQN